MQSVGSVGQSPFTWTNLLFYSLSCRHTMNNISKHVKKTLDMYNINIVPCLLWLQDNVSGYLLRHLCISLRAGLLICQRLRNNHMDDLASLAICTLWYINLTFSAFQGFFYEIHSCVFCRKEQTLPRNAIHIRLRDKVFWVDASFQVVQGCHSYFAALFCVAENDIKIVQGSFGSFSSPGSSGKPKTVNNLNMETHPKRN